MRQTLHKSEEVARAASDTRSSSTTTRPSASLRAVAARADVVRSPAMPLTQQQATQIAQLLGQYQDVARFVIEAGRTPQLTAANLFAQLNMHSPLAGAVFGFAALSFVYTYDAVVKEEGFPVAVVAVVNMPVLNIALNQRNTNEPAEHACLRHLRNCFAHGLFQIQVQGGIVQVELHDRYPNGGAPTFEARCAVDHVIELAERLLVASFNYASAIVHAPAASAPPAAAPPLPGPAPAPATPAAAAPRPAATAAAPAPAPVSPAPPVVPAGSAAAQGNQGGGGDPYVGMTPALAV